MAHEVYMDRCLELALLGLGTAAPNPMVGCVIVHDDRIIGEGYHEKFGASHAEVNAINSVEDQELLKDSTLYVNLEPCCHHGKTPPCSELIIDKKIPRVVIGSGDPYPKVDGGGIERLKEAGIDVTVDVLKDQCAHLNRRFFTTHQKNRPYVILKWAQSADGFMAPHDQKEGHITWISGKTSRMLSHKWRSEEQGILIGSNTVLKDNPMLTTRDYSGASPTRIVLDPDLETSTVENDHNIFNDDATTLIYNHEKDRVSENVEWVKVDENGYLPDVLNNLAHRRILSIIIEGGPSTLRGVINSNLWDEARIFTGKAVLNEGIMAPLMDGELRSIDKIENDLLQFYVNHRS